MSPSRCIRHRRLILLIEKRFRHALPVSAFFKFHRFFASVTFVSNRSSSASFFAGAGLHHDLALAIPTGAAIIAHRFRDSLASSPLSCGFFRERLERGINILAIIQPDRPVFKNLIESVAVSRMAALVLVSFIRPRRFPSCRRPTLIIKSSRTLMVLAKVT